MHANRVLVAGGALGLLNNSLYHMHTSVEIFDFTTNAWTRAADMSIPRAHFGLTTLADGTVLAIGGVVNLTAYTTSYVASAERYFPHNDSWVRAPAFDLAKPRGFFSAVTLRNGSVFIAGGYVDVVLFKLLTSDTYMTRVLVSLYTSTVCAPLPRLDRWPAWVCVAPMCRVRVTVANLCGILRNAVNLHVSCPCHPFVYCSHYSTTANCTGPFTDLPFSTSAEMYSPPRGFSCVRAVGVNATIGQCLIGGREASCAACTSTVSPTGQPTVGSTTWSPSQVPTLAPILSTHTTGQTSTVDLLTQSSTAMASTSATHVLTPTHTLPEGSPSWTASSSPSVLTAPSTAAANMATPTSGPTSRLSQSSSPSYGTPTAYARSTSAPTKSTSSQMSSSVSMLTTAVVVVLALSGGVLIGCGVWRWHRRQRHVKFHVIENQVYESSTEHISPLVFPSLE